MQRYAGILCSVTSLPSRFGIGCFSQEAYDFVDWLKKAGQHYWQILPLGPVSHSGSFDSPYQAFSAFAGNPNFISLEDLIAQGVLTEQECSSLNFGTKADSVDYDKIFAARQPLLYKAYTRSNISKNPDFQKFVYENSWWLEDYALFMAVREFFREQPWYQWPEDIRMHWGNALDYYREKLYFQVEFHKYLQFQFHTQWQKLKKYANDRDIEIVGDIPIYVSMDSSDVWAHPEMFQLDQDNRQTQVAGVPPDGFTPDGQLWGNPLYRWEYHEKTGFQWWVTRIWHSFTLYDVVRIDHFRGFDEYFAIPAEDDTARNGHWEKGPGIALFDAIRANLGDRKIIAEDLGYMTQSVRQLVKDTAFPNMKILEFAFDVNDENSTNDYLPHNYSRNCVVYTGTHDNSTVCGWLKSISKEEKQRIRDYLCDQKSPAKDLHWTVISAALRSVADTCIIPIQDYLGLDDQARMNIPGTVGCNWMWRLKPGQLTEGLAEKIRKLTALYGRINRKPTVQQKQEKIEADEKSSSTKTSEAENEGRKEKAL